MKFFLGIDPGKSGAASVLNQHGKIAVLASKELVTIRFDKSSEREISLWFETLKMLCGKDLYAALEKVRSSPQMGRVSVFTFGWGYGFLRGQLSAFAIPFEEPIPQRWQKELGCLSGGDKNVTKKKAHELWPDQAGKIGHHNADSFLIAEYLRRTHVK